MKKEPLILCIMDGFGLSPKMAGNGIKEANTPHLDYLFQEYPNTTLEASGERVGLPEGQMGNSEVGHLNIGAGRVVYQSLTLINKAIKDGSFFENAEYLKALNHAKETNHKVHIFGLCSDGGVHSHINHFVAMLKLCEQLKLDKVFVHCFMDGRDVSPQAGITYLNLLQKTMDELHTGAIASIHGRYYVMDRDKNNDRVDLSYKVMVERKGESFTSYAEYLKQQYITLPLSSKDASDEFIVPAYNKQVDGTIGDGDSIIFLNFRPDRAIQIATIITNPEFYAHPSLDAAGLPSFKAYRPAKELHDIHFVCSMKYAASVLAPVAFELPKLDNILGQVLADNNKTQLRIAETEKYAHVTFFFDGTVNYDGISQPALKGCRRGLVNSPKVATYDLKPEMSAFEVHDLLLKELDKGDLDVVILNFANCDMVGHTAIMSAVIKAVETVDKCVGSIYEYTKIHGGRMLITADHGNAEVLLDSEGHPMTAHTTNKVPFIITDKKITKLRNDGVLADIAPTMLEMLGIEKPKEMDGSSLIVK